MNKDLTWTYFLVIIDSILNFDHGLGVLNNNI